MNEDAVSNTYQKEAAWVPMAQVKRLTVEQRKEIAKKAAKASAKIRSAKTKAQRKAK